MKNLICLFKGHDYKFSHIEPDGWGLYNWEWKSCKRCGYSIFDKKPTEEGKKLDKG